MRYYYTPPTKYYALYGIKYTCDHPLYNECTLYLSKDIGLAVIQQRESNKTTFWTAIDPYLVDEIYLHPGFWEIFKELGRGAEDGLYPTITVRKLMWRLRMKPLPKERWETTFDRRMV